MSPNNHSFKASLTSILLSLLVNSPQSKINQQFLFTVSNLQNVMLLLWLQFSYTTQKSSFSLDFYLSEILEAIFLRKVFSHDSNSSLFYPLLFCIWAYMTVLFTYCVKFCADIVLRGVKPSPNFIFQFHLAFMFSLVNLTTFALWTKNRSSNDESFYEEKNFLKPLSILFLVLNYTLTGVLSLFHFTPFKGQNLLAARTSNAQYLIFLSKAISVPFINFIYKEESHSLRIMITVVLLFLSMTEFIWLIKSVPYFNYKIMKQAIVWSLISALINIANTLTVLVDFSPRSMTSLLYVELVLFPLIAKQVISYFEQTIRYYTAASENQLKSQDEIFKKLLGLSSIKEKLRMSLNTQLNADLSEAYLFGDLASHAQNCTEQTCLCHQNLTFQQGDSVTEGLTNLKGVLLEYLYNREMFILQSGISNLSKNKELKISYASHILNSENSKFSQLLMLMSNLTDKNASFFTGLKRRILLQSAENSLQRIFQEQREGVLDIKAFVDFQNDKINFLQLLISNTQKYIAFWSHYKQHLFLLTKLLQINQDMEQEASIIGKKWTSFLGEHKQFFFQSMSPHYCAYLDLVRNLPFKALKTAQKSPYQENHVHFGYKEHELINNKTLGLDNTMVFYVSLQKDKILFSSANIYSLLSYKPTDLIGKDFETLFPASLVRGYKKVLRNYLEAASEHKNHLELSLYIKTKLNYVIPCSFYITLYPYIQQESAYVVIMRPKEIKNEFLLLTPDGQIDGYSEKIAKILNLKASLHTFIADISPQARSLAGRGNSKVQSQILLENFSRGSRILEDPQRVKSTIPKEEEDKQDWIEADLTPQGLQGDNERSAKKYLVKTLPQTLGEEKYYKILVKPSNQASYKTFTTAAVIGTYATAKDYGYGPVAEAPRNHRITTNESNKTLIKQLDFLTTEPYQQPEILSSPTSADHLFTSGNRKEASFFVDHPSSPHRLGPRKLSIKLLFGQNFENEDPATMFSPNNKQNPDEEEEETSHFEDLPSRKHKIARSDKASSGVTSLTAGAKLEQAIYSIPPSNLKRWIIIISYIFMIICIGSLVFFVIYEEKNLTMIQDNTSSLRTFALRLVELLMLVDDVQSIRLLQAGLISNTRDTYLDLPLRNETLFADISQEKNSLYNLNNLLRNSMNQIDKSLQKDFYQLLVPLKIDDAQFTVIYRNTFDAVVELVTKTDNILGEKSLETVQDQDIDFIINNSLNELLLNSERIDDYLIQDNDLIFTKTKKIALGLLLAILIIAVLLIISLMSQQKKLIDERDKFLTLFLYTDEAVTNQVLTQIKIFEDALVNDRLENKGPAIIKGQRKEKRALTSALKIDYKSRTRIKSSDPSGLNIKHLQIFGLGVLLMIFLSIPFITILIISDNKNNALDLQIDTINKLNNDFYEMSLLLTSFYDYILNNGTSSIRTRPIDQEWPQILKANSDSQNFLFGLIQTVEKEKICSQTTYTLINNLVYGNLCDLFPADNTGSLCSEIASGVMTKGIQGVNNYFLYTLSNLKDQFVYSNGSFQDAKETLSSQDLIQLEVIVNLWYHDAYIMLERTMETCTMEYIETTHNSEREFLAAYLVVNSVVVMVIVYYMTKWIEIERTGWRKLFRKIPREVILSNKMLKNYLVIENRNILKLE